MQKNMYHPFDVFIVRSIPKGSVRLSFKFRIPIDILMFLSYVDIKYYYAKKSVMRQSFILSI